MANLSASVMAIQPSQTFPDDLMILAPHMDDCVLSCGALLTQLSDKTKIRVIYATDGMASPAPLFPWRDKRPGDLRLERIHEAIEALSVLGVPKENLSFLNLPDGKLSKNRNKLRLKLLELVDKYEPSQILVPFRFDRHPDHLVINHILTSLYNEAEIQADLVEYFVYYNWRLLQNGDVRQYIRSDLLLRVDPGEATSIKREALGCFESQTTIYYPWQTRPNLTSVILDEVSQSPEFFLPYNPKYKGSSIFTKSVTWIRLTHRLEPFLKKMKDQLIATWQRGFH